MAATNAAEFIQLGGTRADLKYDIARGWVTVTDRAPPPAREKKAKQERGELVFEQNIPKVRSRRPAVLRRLHAIDATRVRQTRLWVVSFSILRQFGPRRDAPLRSRRKCTEHQIKQCIRDPSSTTML